MVAVVFLVSLIATVLGGICGIGGGVVIRPVVESMSVMDISALSFLSGLTVLAMSIVNLAKKRKSMELRPKDTVPLGIGAGIGGIIGKYAFSALKAAAKADALIGIIQAALLFVMTLGTLIYVLSKKRIQTKHFSGLLTGVVTGLALGGVSSFLGIGGGPMNIVVLCYMYSMDTKPAGSNSILVILISQCASLLFSLLTGSVPDFSWGMLAVMISGGVVGGFISGYIHSKMKPAAIDKLFCAVLVLVMAICVYNAAGYLM